jgi:AcrR family transcriptional regulator
MARWEPDARGRLSVAALDLYLERGYDQTTVADIAERAGVTERTFFRHFADKREVLFDATNQLQNDVVSAVQSASPELSPMQVVELAMSEGPAFLEQRRAHATRRAAALAATPALMERELLKIHGLRAAVAAALEARGVDQLTARVAAEAGGSCFSAGFAQWVEAGDDRSLSSYIHDAFGQLRLMTDAPTRPR